MKRIVLPPQTRRNAKDFLLFLTPQVLALFNAPKKILSFDVEYVLRQQIYAMSEESCAQKLTRLKELLNEW